MLDILAIYLSIISIHLNVSEFSIMSIIAHLAYPLYLLMLPIRLLNNKYKNFIENLSLKIFKKIPIKIYRLFFLKELTKSVYIFFIFALIK